MRTASLPIVPLFIALLSARDERDAQVQRRLFYLSVGLLAIFALGESLIASTGFENLESEFNLGFTTAVSLVSLMFWLLLRIGWLGPRASVDVAASEPASSNPQ